VEEYSARRARAVVRAGAAEEHDLIVGVEHARRPGGVLVDVER
jgi:hypothetical protein